MAKNVASLHINDEKRHFIGFSLRRHPQHLINDSQYPYNLITYPFPLNSRHLFLVIIPDKRPKCRKNRRAAILRAP